MNELLNALFREIEANSESILEVENYIWTHPELGYREWNTHKYLKLRYEELGYIVHEAGNIPGFYVDIDTGRPGPKIGIFGEMDGLCIPEHPDADPDTGAVHACNHHCQCTAVYGVAVALKAPHVLDGLCGSIRLFAVPCEELISEEFFAGLKEKNIVRFAGGKQEFIARGYLDGVDMAFMVHGGIKGFSTNLGCNGNIRKHFTFIGKTAHVAGAYEGRNALYAATAALNAGNAIRETFRDESRLRYYASITKCGDAIGNIPAEVHVEAGVRARNMKELISLNEKVNRAYAASAASLGCRLVIDDKMGYCPRTEDRNLQDVFHEVAPYLFAANEIHRDLPPATGCTDMGDVSAIMPVCHAFVGDGGPAGHTAMSRVIDPVVMGITSAKLQAGVVALLLSDQARRAKKVIAEANVLYPSKEAWLDAIDGLSFHQDAVFYQEDNSITLRYTK